MPVGNHAKVTAACIALCAFAVAIIAGVAVDNPLDVTLWRALVALGACFVVGYGVGVAGEHVFMSRLIELSNAQRSRGEQASNQTSHSSAGAVPPPA